MKKLLLLISLSILNGVTLAQFNSGKLEKKNGLYLYEERAISRHEAFSILKKNADSKTHFYISRVENYLGYTTLVGSSVYLATLTTSTDTKKRDYLYPGIGAVVGLGLLLDASNQLQRSIQLFNKGIRPMSERRVKIDWRIGIGYGTVRVRF